MKDFVLQTLNLLNAVGGHMGLSESAVHRPQSVCSLPHYYKLAHIFSLLVSGRGIEPLLQG